MDELNVDFNTLVDTMYSLPLEDRLELKELLEHNIADSRRDEITKNIKASKKALKNGSLKFSSDITELKRMV
ncbi:hypothetical protein [Pedobacter endophyticus]|uniref:Addiction module component n=1 Tax=Pedobacter endophyticus TaxID=2789740 RepID=A0A7S9KZV7_9SPHI|nr:hypothetical protein [Pedobacter endophyticus]QPH39900.1 hypothetical protein IZT61_01030 [Pedobacter endophyticus]